MSRWKPYILLNLALALGALGCGGGGSSSPTVVLQISPTAAIVVTNLTQQFSSQVTPSTDTAVTWTVACATGVTAGTCGTIDATTGLYTAPPTIPTTTSNGTTTPAPKVTITGTAHADTTKTQAATVTIITGISISISPTTATIGTSEHFDNFVATVNNPGCTTTLTTDPCRKVTWSVPTTGGVGSIDANSGVYTAPGMTPNPSTVTVTATSVADITVTATATITIVAATPPTVTSVSPKNAALGSLFQDVYITGTNFISTNIVYINNAKLDPALNLVSIVSSSLIRVRIAADKLAAPPPSGFLEFSVSQQQPGTTKVCASAPDHTPCQVVVRGVRPAIVGPSPDSIPQGTTGGLNFNVNGGFYGTSVLPATPAVNATYDGLTRGVVVDSTNITRQLSIGIGGLGNSSDFGIAGLHQVALYSNVDSTKFAVTNLAVQPDVSANPPTAVTGSPLPVGTSPSDVAINPATGIAAVVNTGSDDMTLIDLKPTTPIVIAASICTGGAPVSGKCPAAGPQSVAVAHLTSPAVKNIALVANTTAKTVTMIDLDTGTLSTPLSTTPDSPVGVGINPVTGRALVTMQTKNYGMLIDVTTASPTLVGVVSISTGANSRVAVEPHLNWALATPGGLGSLGIVDLGRQTTNTITNLSRASGTVTVTTQGGTTLVPQPLQGDAVSITGVADASFDGIYTVSTIGPGNTKFTYTQTADASHPDTTSTSGTASYSSPVATVGLTTGIQGIGINPETQTAILVDPLSSGGRVYFFSLVDQLATTLTLGTVSETGAVAGAFNPLTNTAFVVNPADNKLSVIDPATPKRLPTPTSTFDTGSSPVAVAVDPASNRVVVVNHGGTPGSVSIFNLDTTMKTQQVAITETSPKTFVTTSMFPGLPAPSALKLTILGKGFSGGSSPSAARLDGIPLATTFVSDRELTAVVLPAQLSSPRRFALDVVNPTGPPSNAADFTVIQSIDLSASGGCTPGPLPAGVAIDPELGVAGRAAVTLSGCSKVALIDLSDGTGSLVNVGLNPLGVAVLPRLHMAIVANNGNGNVSVVDETGPSVTRTVATGAQPMGVAADQDTGEAAVANSAANTVTVLDVSTGSIKTISNVQRPIAVAFNYRTHQVAVAASSSNSVGIASGSGGGITASFSVNLPTSVVFDPVPGDCGASNIDGCFLANSSTGNAVEILDPVAQTQTRFLVGINPTAIAYNYLTSTLISTNTASRTVTVYDFIDRRIRAVLNLPPAPPNSTIALTGPLQFAVDIHPLTNLAVIADTANGRVLLVPVPR